MSNDDKKKPDQQDESTDQPSKRQQLEAEEKASQIDEDFVKQRAEEVTDDDINEVFEKADEIKDKFRKGGPLGRFLEDVKLLIAIVKDYWHGRYREIPFNSIGAIVFTLLYVLNPFDLIPDAIPVIGYIDDAAVVAICLNLVEQDLQDYKVWKESQESGEGDVNAAA